MNVLSWVGLSCLLGAVAIGGYRVAVAIRKRRAAKLAQADFPRAALVRAADAFIGYKARTNCPVAFAPERGEQ